MRFELTDTAASHKTETKIIKSPPSKVDAEADMTLKVVVSCPDGCDLQGKGVTIVAGDGTKVGEALLAKPNEKANETDEFKVKAPAEVGDYSWKVVFPSQEVAGVLHEESSAPLDFSVKPHMTSMAVWDFPTPVIVNSRFKVKVGASCSAGCALEGKKVEVLDDSGETMARGKLGGTPWPQTTSLYWAEVKLKAPAQEGVFSRKVSFAASGLKLPHDGASYNFYFRTAKPGNYLVTVQAVDKASGSPLKNAVVLMHPYEGSAGDDGVAKMKVAKGRYELNVSKSGYKDFQTTLEVTGNTMVRAELLLMPPMY